MLEAGMAQPSRFLLTKHECRSKNSGSSFGDSSPLGFLTTIDLKPIGHVMSHTAPQGDRQISRVHTLSLSKEIGERLRFNLDSDRAVAPLHLIKLMTLLQRADTRATEMSRQRLTRSAAVMAAIAL